MKICYLIPFYLRPTETFIFNEISRISDKKVISIVDEDVFNSESVEFFKEYSDLLFDAYPFVKRKRLEKYNQFMELLVDRVNEMDILHCQFGVDGLFFLPLKKLTGKPFVVSFRGYDVSEFAKTNPGVYDRLFVEGDLFLVRSNAMKKDLIDLGCDGNKITVHHSGIDYDNISKCIRNPEKVILNVGRLVEKKGTLNLIQAFQKINLDGYRLKIIGDGPLKEKIRNYIEANRINNIELIGNISNKQVIKEMSCSSVFVMPSIVSKNGDKEGIPVSLMEAMAVGVSVVASDHSGISELVCNQSGVLVAENNITDLASGIKKAIMQIDNVERIKKGKEIVKKDFNIDCQARKLKAIYLQLLSQTEISNDKYLKLFFEYIVSEFSIYSNLYEKDGIGFSVNKNDMKKLISEVNKFDSNFGIYKTSSCGGKAFLFARPKKVDRFKRLEGCFQNFDFWKKGAKWIKLTSRNCIDNVNPILNSDILTLEDDSTILIPPVNDFSRISIEKLKEYKRLIETYKIMHCNPSMLVLLLDAMSKNGLIVEGKVYINSTYEPLYKSKRKQIMSFLDCELQDQFGSSEVGPIMIEQSNGGYKVFEENVHVKFMKNSNCDRVSKLLVTDIKNLYMPFVNYETGDYFRDGKYRDGLHYVEYAGRGNEVLGLESGTIFPVDLDDVVSKYDEILLYQFRYSEKIILDILFRSDYDMDLLSDSREKRLVDELRRLLPGEDIEINYPNQIKPSYRGKYSIVVNERCRQ